MTLVNTKVGEVLQTYLRDVNLVGVVIYSVVHRGVRLVFAPHEHPDYFCKIKLVIACSRHWPLGLISSIWVQMPPFNDIFGGTRLLVHALCLLVLVCSGY